MHEKFDHFQIRANNTHRVATYFTYHKIQIMLKQDSYTKANESDEEAQKETMRLIDIGLPQSKK